MTLEEIEREEFELREQQLALSLQLEQLLRDKKLEYFQPNPKQLAFFENADKRHRAGYCGNRFGKSTIGVVEDCCWLLGERPFFPANHPLRRKGIPTRGVKILVIAEDWDKIKEIFTNDDGIDRLGKFFEYLPKDSIKSFTREQKGRINSITVRVQLDGVWRESIVIFDTVQSYKNNPKSFESSDWDAIHIDEPVMQELWTAVSRGLLDRGGFTWWLLTPLGFPWMYEYSLGQTAAHPDRAWWFEASMLDNPLLDEISIQDYLDSLSPEELECRKSGKPLAHGRRVYGHFDEKVHVWNSPNPPPGWEDNFSPPYSWYSGFALDIHPQTPDAVLFATVSPAGDIFFYDEIFKRLELADLASAILAKCEGKRIGWQLCDPSAWNEQKDRSTWANTLAEFDLFVEPASKEKTLGIKETQQIFGKKFPRKVYVMPHMYNFLREIKSYFFDKENKPFDKNDHLMECLYRTYVHDRLVFRGQPSKESPPQFGSEEYFGVSLNLNPLGMANMPKL